MRRRCLVVLVLVLAGAMPRGACAEDAPGASPAAPAAHGPRIRFDRDAHDFGPVAQEADLRTEFRVTNAGDAPLHLRSVRADCGCAGAASDGNELAPGASTTVRVTMRTLTMSGILRKRILVDSDDPTRPTAEFSLKADIFQGIVLAPARFYFGDVAAGTAPSVAVKVLYRDGHGKPFRVTGLEAPGLALRLEQRPFDEDAWHGALVTATFTAPPPVGTVSGTVILRTDDPGHPRFTLPVQAFVSGKVWVDRRDVSLGIVPAGQGRETAVTVRPFSRDLDLGTVTAKAHDGRLEVRVLPSGRAAGTGAEWKVTLRLPPGAPPGRFREVVEIASSLPGEPPAEVTVVGTVAELPK